MLLEQKNALDCLRHMLLRLYPEIELVEDTPKDTHASARMDIIDDKIVGFEALLEKSSAEFQSNLNVLWDHISEGIESCFIFSNDEFVKVLKIAPHVKVNKARVELQGAQLKELLQTAYVLNMAGTVAASLADCFVDVVLVPVLNGSMSNFVVELNNDHDALIFSNVQPRHVDNILGDDFSYDVKKEIVDKVFALSRFICDVFSWSTGDGGDKQLQHEILLHMWPRFRSRFFEFLENIVPAHPKFMHEYISICEYSRKVENLFQQNEDSFEDSSTLQDGPQKCPSDVCTNTRTSQSTSIDAIISNAEINHYSRRKSNFVLDTVNKLLVQICDPRDERFSPAKVSARGVDLYVHNSCTYVHERILCIFEESNGRSINLVMNLHVGAREIVSQWLDIIPERFLAAIHEIWPAYKRNIAKLGAKSSYTLDEYDEDRDDDSSEGEDAESDSNEDPMNQRHASIALCIEVCRVQILLHESLMYMQCAVIDELLLSLEKRCGTLDSDAQEEISAIHDLEKLIISQREKTLKEVVRLALSTSFDEIISILPKGMNSSSAHEMQKTRLNAALHALDLFCQVSPQGSIDASAGAPPSMLQFACGRTMLISRLLILERIAEVANLDMQRFEDISVTETERLAKLIGMIVKFGDRMISSESLERHRNENLPSFYEWKKLKLWKKMLGMNLKTIELSFCLPRGSLRGYFTSEEITSVICSIFSHSPARDEAVDAVSLMEELFFKLENGIISSTRGNLSDDDVFLQSCEEAQSLVKDFRVACNWWRRELDRIDKYQAAVCICLGVVGNTFARDISGLIELISDHAINNFIRLIDILYGPMTSCTFDEDGALPSAGLPRAWVKLGLWAKLFSLDLSEIENTFCDLGVGENSSTLRAHFSNQEVSKFVQAMFPQQTRVESILLLLNA